MADFVSIIVPTFNEKGNILALIEGIHHELSGIAHEIIVVDDNSPDGTYALVMAQGHLFVNAILRKEEPSLAYSIRDGIKSAKGNILVVMDSDFNHQPKYIPQMIKNLEFYDVVVASRFVYGGAMDSRARHLLSWVFNVFVRVVTGGSITDSLYGFFAIHRAVLEKTEYEKIFWGYGDYCIRLMFYLQRMRVNILQIPTINGKRLKGQSNGRFLQTFLQYTRETLKLVINEQLKHHD
jgi:dolichol-phosphate mannosyltransferase